MEVRKIGSGSGSSYSGTSGGSQPYQENYHVVSSELNKDKKDSDIYSKKSGYFKNPTSTNLEASFENGSIYMNGSKAHGNFTYVMDKNGNIIFGKRVNPNDRRKRAPHPTLIGGKDPTVQCAGMIEFKKGRIVSVNNQSGHFRPNIESMKKVDSTLTKLYNKHPELFDKLSKWRKNK